MVTEPVAVEAKHKRSAGIAIVLTPTPLLDIEDEVAVSTLLRNRKNFFIALLPCKYTEKKKAP
jgi:hypothetical protein